ncbi:helix-turn-helix transcriptional regulator [Candidatus Tisiphia endosymbiont of Thecophora atra]|uniref:helix-turn-helix domain-containing protein n=1 Tax=Candidatus Tisiphia endosymbiont of Thecophora atra TaxID=3066258 RepID=UPI00312C8086
MPLITTNIKKSAEVRKNISPTDIEKKTGLSRNTIYGIVAGNSKNPTAHNLQLIAKGLDVSLESILIDEKAIPLELLSHAQINVFFEATEVTIKTILEKNINFSLTNLINLIKEVYHYSLKKQPEPINKSFVDWLIDKHYEP